MSVSALKEVVINDKETLEFKPPDLYYDADQYSFEEVAGICSNQDEIDMRSFTLRSFILGLIVVTIMSVFHMWIYDSPVLPIIHPVLVIIISHILGKIWSLIPCKMINCGPWTIKEHVVVFIMGNIAWMFFRVYSYSTITFLQYTQQQSNFKFICSCFIIIAVQFLGFTFAGNFRSVLVWCPDAVWPINFPYIALFRTLHETSIKKKKFGNAIKQNLWEKFRSNYLTFFWIITIIQFIYCWFPHFLMPVLGAFSWMCMIKPTNYLLSQLTGHYGLGLGSFSFNWFTVSWTLGSPMIIPRWAMVNIAVGFAIATWIITPIVYFTNVWNTYDRPIAEVTRSSSEWSALGLVSTAAAFANISAVIFHMFLHRGNILWDVVRTRSLNNMGNDLHSRFIAHYRTVPDWWFFIVSLLAFMVIVVAGQISHIIDWYKTFLSFIVPSIFVLPFALIASTTGMTTQNPTIYYLLVIIATGFWADNKSTTLAFVTIGYSTYCQAIQLIINMKLGHYMKIAPVTVFLVQLVACFVSPSVSMAIQYYYFEQAHFVTNHTSSLATINFESTNVGAAITNEINFFGLTNLRNRNLLWSLLIGAILPILFRLVSHRWKWCRLVHIPLILTFISWMPLVSAGALFTWILIGILTTFFFSEFYWKRHVYLTTSALNGGFFLYLLIIGGPLIMYGIQFPSWWGFGGVHNDGCPLTLMNITAASSTNFGIK